MKRQNFKAIIALLAIVLIFESCKTYFFRSNYSDTNRLIHETNNLITKPFLKTHHKNGNVSILEDTWQIDTISNIVSGHGKQFNYNRRFIYQGNITIPVDSIAMFETNTKLDNTEHGRVAALSILAGVDVIVTVLCLVNPKACFGSCPTFYINPDNNFHYADAEGFTNAIVPSMEYGDVDALNNQAFTSDYFSITMKNEALETHVVNEVKLLAYPRNIGERVYQSPSDAFYLSNCSYLLSSAEADEGDISALIKYEDKMERFSFSDEADLNSKEEIYLTFNDVERSGDLGLIMNFRQTLMTTYLFYNAMGYMGDEVGDIFALLETDPDIREKFDATTKLLGGIDVYCWNDQSKIWEFQGSFYETGPIAINKQIIPLTDLAHGSKVKLKLLLNKGLWRIEHLALANILEEVQPIEVKPYSVFYEGEPSQLALDKIVDPEKYLVSMPGSEYRFDFTLPEESDDFELFLYSKGYYLEWMREHWIKGKDLLKLRQMVYKPEKYLKEVSGEYKQYETTMEQEFWNSRIDTKTFSYYE